ncbi:MAG: response regulator [Anaerolineae bacterium]
MTMTRVLIVDDQPRFRRHLRRLLTYAGLDVVGEAETIPQAEEVIQQLRPDLVILDVILPGVNGLAGTQRLKALLPDLRVILISAYRDQADGFRSAAEEVGADAFIAKDDLSLEVVQTWRASVRGGGES